MDGFMASLTRGLLGLPSGNLWIKPIKRRI